MKKWFIHCETDVCETDRYDLIEAEDIREAETEANVMAADNYQDYDFLFEEDRIESEEEGLEYIEGEHWSFEVEEYNPEKHNDYLYNSDLKEEVKSDDAKKKENEAEQ